MIFKLEKIYLLSPSIEHKNAYIEMMLEWEKTNENINPSVIKQEIDYDEWIDVLETYKKSETCPPELVPSSTYFLVNDDNKLLGAINIRHYLNKQLLQFGGHIGYGIRPTERKKGYATIMLKLALEKCKEIGLKQVLITCDKDNIGSAKTIIANNGILENEVVIEGKIIQRYWITI